MPWFERGSATTFTKTLDAFLRRQVELRRAAGIVTRVARGDGEILYASAFGLRDPDLIDAIGETTLFRLASMTKPITAVATLTLVEKGEIAIDDPVERFLPEFASITALNRGTGRSTAARTPTIRDLLRHMSGLSYRFMNVPGVAEAYERLGVDDGMAAATLGLGENLCRLAQAPLQAQPGQCWGYGLSYDVLGAVIERVSNEPLDRFIGARIASPLDLKSLCFHVPEEARAKLARATVYEGEGKLRALTGEGSVPFPVTGGHILCDPDRALSPIAYPSGGSGALATIGDYLRFARMLLNGGELEGVRLLRRETVDEMRSPQTSGLPISLAGPGYDFGYGVAVLVDSNAANSPQPRGAYGWSGVYGSALSIDPVNDICIVVMTQTAVEGMAIADEFLRAFYESWRA